MQLYVLLIGDDKVYPFNDFIFSGTWTAVSYHMR